MATHGVDGDSSSDGFPDSDFDEQEDPDAHMQGDSGYFYCVSLRVA